MGRAPLLQLPVAPRLQQGGSHARHRQLQRPVVGITQQRLQIAGITQGHGAIDDLPLAARLVLDGGQRVEVVIHQLAYRLQRLLELGLADALGLVDQLVGKLAQPQLGEIPPLQGLHPASGGTGIPQPEHRVHGDEQADQLVGIVDGQALADAIEKVVGGGDGAIALQLGAGAVVNAVKLVLVLDPSGAEAGQPLGMQAHLGPVLAEGEHQLQVAGRLELGIFGLMEVIAAELVGLGILAQQTPEGAQQAGLAPGVLADEHCGVVQPEREAIYSAKTFDFNAFQKHAAISSPS